MIGPKSAGMRLAAAFEKELIAANSKSFTAVSQTEGRDDRVPLALDLKLIDVKRSRYGRRASPLAGAGTEAGVAVAGRLVDRRLDRVLVTFATFRKSEGGLIGAGGLFTASEPEMIDQLMRWTAQDLIGALKKAQSP